MTTSTSKLPTHRAYVVTGEDDKRQWTDIGAQWPHKDGKGFTLKLKAMPIGGEIVLRVPEPQADEPEAGASA